MSKKVSETEETKEPITSRISKFLQSFKKPAAAKADDEEAEAKADDEEEMSTAEVVEAKADDEPEAAKADDVDPDDEDDPNKDDDEDEDDIEINGEKVNLKDPAATRAAFESLLAIQAEQNELLVEASADIEAKDAQIAKTTTEVKKEIKSSFVPPSSKRSHKIGTEDKEQYVPEGLMPKEGTYAYAAMQDTLSRKKASEKKK